ncbi:MAG: hypothetical protein O3C40_34670 [Planctomycetota bacterium]|nr:hypothetical protein [Planctomycetota bacterium]
MWSHLVFAAFLLGASGLLLWIHWRAWRAAQAEGLDGSASDFRRRQFRRRMQASAMIGIVGVAVVVSLAITDPMMTAILWLVVLSLVIWMLLLAFADMVSSYFYYSQVRAQHTAEHASLQAQLDKIRRREGNGHAHE